MQTGVADFEGRFSANKQSIANENLMKRRAVFP
jgi:hypothetical protein